MEYRTARDRQYEYKHVSNAKYADMSDLSVCGGLFENFKTEIMFGTIYFESEEYIFEYLIFE